ncbi:MAG TPA: ABC transporter substrate-binding protein [Acidimicrobiales bacterium]|nr:ABC transporter substrate-binding protein [Acidimicrobiales bacterium]
MAELEGISKWRGAGSIRGRRPVRTRTVATVALVVVALLGVACSRSKNDTATVLGNSTATTASTGGSAATFGTMKEPVCGKAPAGETNKATEQGITANSIGVGTISDVGFSGAPGLNQELWDASDVFTKWCNSLGGINGRLIKDDKLDAALFNYNQQIVKACGMDFALVGGGGVFDDTGQKTRLKCLLPDVPAYLVTSTARGSDLTAQVTPGPLNSLNFGTARYLAEKYPDSINAVGYLTGNVPTTITNKNQYEEAGKAFGFKTVYDAQYNAAGEPTWVPIAQQIKDKGVKGLYFVGEPASLGALVAALAQINYKLDWISGAANHYDPKLLKAAGSALGYENVIVGIGTTPFQATDVPAVQQYEALFDQFLPSSTRKQAALGMNSFSAWLLFAQAAKACGANLTRKCMYENATKVTRWDGGGIQAPTNVSQDNVAGPCMVNLKASPSGWTIIKWDPTEGVFNCSSDNVVALHGNYGKGVTLADVGKSMSDLP